MSKKNNGKDWLIGGAWASPFAVGLGWYGLDNYDYYSNYLRDKFYKDEGGHIDELKNEKNQFKQLSDRDFGEWNISGKDELSRKADDHIFRMKKALRRADNSTLLGNSEYKSKLDDLKKASSEYAKDGFKDDSKSLDIDQKINDLNTLEEASTVADKPPTSDVGSSLSDYIADFFK